MQLLIRLASIIVYRLLFHPLHKIPGPLFARISNIPYSISYLGGRQPYDVYALHEKYGPVVRVAPNELSFNSPQSWQDIYGIRQGHEVLIKSKFYKGGSFANQASSLVSERDPAKHREMRNYLSSAFSERSLKDQEHLIAKVIDRFIEKLGELESDL